MKLKKKSSLYPLLFGVAWIIIAFFTKSWEPALIGGIFILVGFFLIIHDIKIAKKQFRTRRHGSWTNRRKQTRMSNSVSSGSG